MLGMSNVNLEETRMVNDTIVYNEQFQTEEAEIFLWFLLVCNYSYRNLFFYPLNMLTKTMQPLQNQTILTPTTR